MSTVADRIPRWPRSRDSSRDAGGPRAPEARDVVPADVGARVRRRRPAGVPILKPTWPSIVGSGAPRRARSSAERARRQRLVRSPRRRDQRAAAGPFRPDASPGRAGLVHRDRHGPLLSLLVGALLGPWVFVASVVGSLARVGVQRAAASPQDERLVRLNYGGGPSVTRACRGSPVRRRSGIALPDTRITLPRAPLQRGRVRDHGAERLQGDRRRRAKLGVRTLPVQLGVGPAAILACVIMALAAGARHRLATRRTAANLVAASAVVAALLARAGLTVLMPWFLREPRRKRAPLYNANRHHLCYVAGMMVSAFAMRSRSPPLGH